MTFRWEEPRLYATHDKECIDEPYEGFFEEEGFTPSKKYVFCEHESFAGRSQYSVFGTHKSDSSKIMITPRVDILVKMFIQQGTHSFSIGPYATEGAIDIESIPQLLVQQSKGRDINSQLTTIKKMVHATGGKAWVGLDFELDSGSYDFYITHPHKDKSFWNTINGLYNLIYFQSKKLYEGCISEQSLAWVQELDEEYEALKRTSQQRYKEKTQGVFKLNNKSETIAQNLARGYLEMIQEKKEEYGFANADAILAQHLEGYCDANGIVVKRKIGLDAKIEALACSLDAQWRVFGDIVKISGNSRGL